MLFCDRRMFSVGIARIAVQLHEVSRTQGRRSQKVIERPRCRAVALVADGLVGDDREVVEFGFEAKLVEKVDLDFHAARGADALGARQCGPATAAAAGGRQRQRRAAAVPEQKRRAKTWAQRLKRVLPSTSLPACTAAAPCGSSPASRNPPPLHAILAHFEKHGARGASALPARSACAAAAGRVTRRRPHSR
jgi:hypothetical protein